MFDIPSPPDPIALFGDWFKQASSCPEIKEANAVCLATVAVDGSPDARMVLMKDYSDAGFVFYTNARSAKGRALERFARAALLFYWEPLGRQVRIRGATSLVAKETADAYFASRGRLSRIGAIASNQSSPLESRKALLAKVDELSAQHPEDDPIPRPPHWRGYCVNPQEIEFWQHGENRLHHRVLFQRQPDGSWKHSLLCP